MWPIVGHKFVCYNAQMKIYIHSFRPYLDQDSLIEQHSALTWLKDHHSQQYNDLFEKYGVKESEISSRCVFASGIHQKTRSHSSLYRFQNNPTMSERSIHAQEKCDEIFEQLYSPEELRAQPTPEHLCHVTCTHYESPSAAQKLVASRSWGDTTQVTHLYHMGCYASLPALRVTSSYLHSGAKSCEIVHTELCSFHMNRENSNVEQIIMKTLFADGAIKYRLSVSENFQKAQTDGLELISLKEVLMPETQNEMSWKISEHGFAMTLSKRVPFYLAKKIEIYMRGLFEKAGLDFDHDKDDCLFAIHPGGPKIIDLIEGVLKLRSDQVEHSKKILKSRGNMSSATLPHIWNEIIQDQRIKNEKTIVTVAFGPGLTITGAVLKLCRI